MFISVTLIVDLINTSNLYVADYGRAFVWPTFSIGHEVVFPNFHDLPSEKPLIVKTISETPRVFRLINFISEEEADSLIEYALTVDIPSHKLKRSSVGATGYTLNNRRTSEGAFDTSSPTSDRIKKRSLEFLGIRPFDETYLDGIQILRYNQTAAYVDHMDWLEAGIDDHTSEHDYKSDQEGTNRFATILLYLTDVEEGGETVFVNTPPEGGLAQPAEDGRHKDPRRRGRGPIHSHVGVTVDGEMQTEEKAPPGLIPLEEVRDSCCRRECFY